MNAVVSEPDRNPVADFRAPGPGERLKSARLARELDLGKMADQLHLTVDMVEAIECDDYSELPARVFVRGYIRNYARAVELPVDSVVSQFDQLWPDDESKVHVHTEPRLPADSRPAGRWASATTWLVLIAVLALFLMWWAGYLDRFTAPVETAQSDNTAIESVAPVGSQAGDERVATPADSALPAAAASPTETAGVTPVIGSGELMLPQRPQELTSAIPPATVAAAEQPSTSAQVPETPAEPSAATSASAVAAGPVIRFDQDCWVDIRDSSRTFKLFGTMRKGTQKTLEGTPPYKMVLGNASGVTLSVDGKPFDLAPYTKDNIARFSFRP
jgi:cytoskeleton protein RodZ